MVRTKSKPVKKISKMSSICHRRRFRARQKGLVSNLKCVQKEEKKKDLKNLVSVNGVIAGEIYYKSPITLGITKSGSIGFIQVYILHDTLGKRMKKEEFTYRLVVCDEMIKKHQLKEGSVLIIKNFERITNTRTNLRAGQSNCDYLLGSSALVKPMF